MSLKIKYDCDRFSFPHAVWQRIFELSLSPSLIAVNKSICCKVNATMQSVLHEYWNNLPSNMHKILTELEKRPFRKQKTIRFCALFAALHRKLARNLQELDSGFLPPIRQRFHLSLDPERFVCMHERIVKLQCFENVFPLLGDQIDKSRVVPESEAEETRVVVIVSPIAVERHFQTNENFFSQVTFLFLQQQNLLSIPCEFFNFRRLQYLDLSENFLTDIPSEIQSLKKLEELNLRGNPLDVTKYRKIANRLADLPALKKLGFDDEEFQKVYLRKVQERTCLQSVATKLQLNPNLDLSSLRTRLLDPVTANLSRGMAFDLHDENLGVLPKEIFHCLRYVRTLNLSATNLSAIPEGVVKLQDLVEINLCHNPLPRSKYKLIAGRLANLPKLKKVRFDDKSFVECFEFARKQTSRACVIL
ncbi:MAG: leucine-rich repeat domain-containing protein [Chlamydiales bacterium]